MAAETFTSPQWTEEQYVPRAGEMAIAYGVINVTNQAEDGDILQFFKLPQRAVVTGGRLQGALLDSGTGTLQIDVGITGNTDKYHDGAAQGTTANFGSTDVIFYQELNGTDSFGTNGVEDPLSSEEEVIGEVITTANAGGTGNIALIMNYTTNKS